ncbi:MAG: serine/threonine-protein kinase [Candidatus Melainabacteria bacterium]|nr:serine/threonine-protein kinase [Candidatus Melainabacteria bacterium]
MAKPPQIKALPELPPGPDEVYIPYSAWRAQGRFRHALLQEKYTARRIAQIAAIVIASYAAVVAVIRMVPNYFFGIPSGICLELCVYGLLFIISYPLLTSPTNVQIGKEGIRIHWLSFLGLLSSPWIKLEYIDFVNVSSFRRGYYKSRAIDIHINKDNVPLNIRRVLRLIAPSLWCVSLGFKPTLKLRFDIAAISHDADVQVLLRTFKNLLPAEKLGAGLLELGDNGGSSFTKLWLDSLDGGERSNSSLSLPQGALETGEVLQDGQFEIVRRLAAGGQAITYLALAHKVNEESGQVVLKEFVLPVRGGIEIRKRALENVEHEARLLQKLNNERIVKFLDCFVDNQKAYLVLEYIDGKSLRKLVQDEGPLSEAEVVRLGIEMCSVLEYLHTLEPAIIHRDFTPENLLLRSTGSLALIDFNVAEQLESQETKTMVGKHCYVSPEQFRGKATTQSDLYACGCTLYWLLTAKDPEPISMSQPCSERPGMTVELNTIVARATAIDVSRRFESAKAMKSELEAMGATRKI